MDPVENTSGIAGDAGLVRPINPNLEKLWYQRRLDGLSIEELKDALKDFTNYAVGSDPAPTDFDLVRATYNELIERGCVDVGFDSWGYVVWAC
jgi:hypothetical protein